MENFEFYVPTKVVFGRGTQSRVGELVKEFGGARVLIHFGGGSAIRSGLLKEVEESLDKSGIKYVEFRTLCFQKCARAYRCAARRNWILFWLSAAEAL